MSKTIRIASRLPVPVTLVEPNPSPDQPGSAPALRSVVIPGAAHPGRETVSEVDADIYKAWKGVNGHHEWLTGELLREVPADYTGDDATSYGHEPGMEALAADKDNTKLAEQGTGGDQPGPVPAAEMNATSDTPNDDTPRSEVGPTGGKHARVVKSNL